MFLIILAKSNTKISQEIINTINHSTNIVDVLKKENLVIKTVRNGYDPDTVEIIIEYDFLFKNNKIN